jgi:hypothetical protein
MAKRQNAVPTQSLPSTLVSEETAPSLTVDDQPVRAIIQALDEVNDFVKTEIDVLKGALLDDRPDFPPLFVPLRRHFDEMRSIVHDLRTLPDLSHLSPLKTSTRRCGRCRRRTGS